MIQESELPRCVHCGEVLVGQETACCGECARLQCALCDQIRESLDDEICLLCTKHQDAFTEWAENRRQFRDPYTAPHPCRADWNEQERLVRAYIIATKEMRRATAAWSSRDQLVLPCFATFGGKQCLK